VRETILECQVEQVCLEVGRDIRRSTREGRVRGNLGRDWGAGEGEGADGVDGGGGIDERGRVGKDGAVRRGRTLWKTG
jgi:hypothetical protein